MCRVRRGLEDRIVRVGNDGTLRLINGIWQYERRVNGRRTRVSTGCRDLDDARRYIDPVFRPLDQFRRGDFIKDRYAYLEAFESARKRARKSGLSFTLTEFDIRRIVNRAWGRCEVTGIVFNWNYVVPGAHKPRPFWASVDRIDHARGYEPDNVRLACTAANLAMNQWGHDVLLQMAAAMVLTGKIDIRQIKAMSRFPRRDVASTTSVFPNEAA